MWRYVVLVVLVVACTPVMSGKKGDKNPKENGNTKNKQDLKDCTWEFGPCILEGAQTCGKGSQTATSTNEQCPVKERSIKCKVPCVETSCRYKSVKNAEGSPCNATTNQKEISQVLVSGDETKCEKTKIEYKPCGKGGARGGKGNKGGKKGQKAERMADDASENKPRGRKNKTTVAPDAVALVDPKAPTGKNCKYARKGPKEECDPVTNTKTITMTLKKKSPATCEPTKTIIKECTVKVKVARPNRKNPKSM